MWAGRNRNSKVKGDRESATLPVQMEGGESGLGAEMGVGLKGSAAEET